MKLEDNQRQRKHKAPALRKISVKYQPQNTKLNQLERIQEGQMDSVLIDINHRLHSQSPSEIKDGVKDLKIILKTNKKDYFQSIAHQFIPRVLYLIDSHHNYKVVRESIIFLAKVASFGKLNQECLRLFRQKGVQIIIKAIKQGKYEQEYYYLLGLVANLSIDSVTLRDLFIQRGAIEVILKAYLRYYYYHMDYYSNNNQNNISFSLSTGDFFQVNRHLALIALLLGDPLPARDKVEKFIKEIISNYQNIDPLMAVQYNMLAIGAIHVIYHYSDLKNEKQCSQLLPELLRLGRINYTADNSLRPIFAQIFEYYSAQPDCKIMHILHGCCYQGKLKSQNLQVLYQQYNPEMYESLFRTAIKHKMNKIRAQMKRPLQEALSIIKTEEQQSLQLAALKFISWILNPTAIEEMELSHQESNTLQNYLLPRIGLNQTFFKKLRHDRRTAVRSLSFTIINSYQYFCKNDWKIPEQSDDDDLQFGFS